VRDMRNEGRAAGALGAQTYASLKRHGRCSAWQARGQKAQATTEFIFVAPVLMAILIGIVLFGIALNNYLALTFATNAAAQQLSISQGISTACTSAEQAGVNAAPLLKQLTTSSFTPTFSGPGGSTCTNLVAGDTAQITATYPCNLKVLGWNFAPSCTLTAQSTMIIQ
jgi:Flp pilus assembly protein TadG